MTVHFTIDHDLSLIHIRQCKDLGGQENCGSYFICYNEANN
jgi:hypothetical protein